MLVGAGTAAAQIHKVPVNGSQPTEIAPDANAISLTVGGGQIVAGNSSGRMATFVVSTDSCRTAWPRPTRARARGAFASVRYA